MADPDSVRRRTGGRSARVRSAVLQATLAQLFEVGYERLSIRQVAAAAGVAPTTVYRRWGSRSELVLAALTEFSAVTIAIPDTGSVRGDLRVLAGEVATALSQPAVTALMRSMITLPDDVAGEYRRSFWADRLVRTEVIFERAVARGELPGAVDPSAVFELLVAPIWFRLLISSTPIDDLALDRWVQAALAAGDS